MLPVVGRRRERGLREQNFDAPRHFPTHTRTGDTEERPKGEETTDTNADNADELSARQKSHLGPTNEGLERTFP